MFSLILPVGSQNSFQDSFQPQMCQGKSATPSKTDQENMATPKPCQEKYATISNLVNKNMLISSY